MKLFLQNNNTEMNYIFHMYIHISLAQLKWNLLMWNLLIKFKIGDIVRISKYKKVFAKENTPNWSGVVFETKKV